MLKKTVFAFVLLAFIVSACRGATPAPEPAAVPTEAASPTATEAAQPTSIPTVTQTAVPIVFPKIDRHPEPWETIFGKITEVPKYDPESMDQWQMDFRSYDASALDLRNSLDDLLFASFDDKTIWPPDDKMPKGFDWKRIMEIGKNPGLGMESLHAEGVTGKGVGIAIIDQTLLVDHQEYADRIRLYEETEDIQGGWMMASMHGPAVASIAAGKTVGVAPEADLYFIANVFCVKVYPDDPLDFSCLAKSVRRIIEVNRQLPAGGKIRVLSMATGWGPESKGYAEIQSAVQEARDAGIFIICSSERSIYGLDFHGLGRPPLSDPDISESYGPGLWWTEDFFQGVDKLSDTLLVPMDSRTTASPTGNDEYVFYREGGWSWSIPYIAGMYALAAQVKPDITPYLFWSTALATGRTIEIQHEGKAYSFGTILDPAALIRTLQGL